MKKPGIGVMVTVPPHATFLEEVARHPYTRYPVYGEDIDDIVGFVHVKDVLDTAPAKRTQTGTSFVPWRNSRSGTPRSRASRAQSSYSGVTIVNSGFCPCLTRTGPQGVWTVANSRASFDRAAVVRRMPNVAVSRNTIASNSAARRGSCSRARATSPA